MKGIAIRFLASVILLITSAAAEEDIRRLYARVDGGVSIPSKDRGTTFETNPLYSVGAGYHFNDIFRTDINLQYRPITIDKSLVAKEANNLSAVLNVYLNLSDSQDNMIPYLTAGIGYGKNKLSSFSNTSNNTNSTITQSGKTINNLIWNAGAGMTIAFINDSRFTIRYSI
jgi:opacity protein-like surface antigen